MTQDEATAIAERITDTLAPDGAELDRYAPTYGRLVDLVRWLMCANEKVAEAVAEHPAGKVIFERLGLEWPNGD